MQFRWKLPASIALVCAMANTATAQTIDTRTGEYGAVTTSIFGQTFTVPDGAQLLNSFTFFITSNASAPTQINFNAYLMRWNGSEPVGSVLYTANRDAHACCTIVGETFASGLFALVGWTRLRSMRRA